MYLNYPCQTQIEFETNGNFSIGCIQRDHFSVKQATGLYVTLNMSAHRSTISAIQYGSIRTLLGSRTELSLTVSSMIDGNTYTSEQPSNLIYLGPLK